MRTTYINPKKVVYYIASFPNRPSSMPIWYGPYFKGTGAPKAYVSHYMELPDNDLDKIELTKRTYELGPYVEEKQ